MSNRDEQKVDGAMKQSRVHAEGQHGDKTHARLIEQLQSGPSGESNEDRERRADEPQRDERTGRAKP
jgi:hypothetical protein